MIRAPQNLVEHELGMIRAQLHCISFSVRQLEGVAATVRDHPREIQSLHCY